MSILYCLFIHFCYQNMSKRYHHCHILSKYNFLSFANFVDFQYVKLVFPCLYGLAPQPLFKYVQKPQSRSTRAASSGNCKVPFCKTSFAQSTFSVKGAKSSNTLPDHLESIADFHIFKKATKFWLVQQQILYVLMSSF